jgi:hypothetical protein
MGEDMRATLPALAIVIAAGSLAGGLALTSASASPAAARTEHFRVISTAAASRRLSVIATGHFTAGGYEIPGALSGGHSTDKAVFPGGRFLVHRHVTHQRVSLPSWCLFTETQRGTYTLGQGSGRFRNISGSGRFSLRITGVIRRSKHGCSRSGKLSAFQQISYETGPVRG